MAETTSLPRALAAGALAFGLASAVEAVPSFELVGIGHLPMEKEPADVLASFASDVDEAGVVVGQSTLSIGAVPQLAAGDFHAVRFTSQGGLEDLGDLASGGDTSAALGIGASGRIVGRADGQADPGGLPPDLADATHAVRWSPDATTPDDIGVGTASSVARAVNVSDHAVGDVGETGHRQAFFYSSGLGISPLPDPPDVVQTTAEAVNASDAIVGHAHTTSGLRAMLWNGIAAPLDLGDLDGDGGDSAAFGINDAGWIVGSSDDGGEQRAFRRDPGTGLLEGLPHLPGGDFSRARDVNEDGWIVGAAWEPSAHAFRAVLWEPDGTIHDLNDLVVAGGDGWVLEEALAVSDAGHVVGTARNPSGEYEGFVLPEPRGPGVFAACAALLSYLARRRSS